MAPADGCQPSKRAMVLLDMEPIANKDHVGICPDSQIVDDSLRPIPNGRQSSVRVGEFRCD